ncbi:hypothetical protein B7C51_04980 [Paenibacillus larvae subsp. pulvifaciens]|uniref:Single-stranded DNA-binding protein n=1 Tax=Paenibacillus larvae subsp. pulvifaciens TaxID=1477 RepID=A0A1V0UQ74_9BACL|nr:hypothetical protein [Paenibacillus larvae]ARF67324.1 hypothetical protein B7C51_04980 [Paenibacillus larvae subsp. pulvifaciens]
MKVPMDEKAIEKTLGEVRFIGRKISKKYGDNGEVIQEVGSVTFDIGAPLYESGNKEGSTIEVKVETDEPPKIKPYGRVKLKGLVYDPYATVQNMRDSSRGVIVDRFTADAILPLTDDDKIVDEETGEINEKPVFETGGKTKQPGK